jgi:hypothetical protein
MASTLAMKKVIKNWVLTFKCRDLIITKMSGRYGKYGEIKRLGRLRRHRRELACGPRMEKNPLGKSRKLKKQFGPQGRKNS